ncbi:ATP-binding cassette domain-containing protein [Ruminococcus sp. Marseille-P6503]|uniref:ATP-binding cassette domain-containing protein n=1 Tax=Ruminococcus sp. Marseille-P6503 TaxID=2364796 RepID=UPI000F53480E|nr:ATP-binding cassette domain-containing protein [Ruminococcus sp. Marseille-P6503]
MEIFKVEDLSFAYPESDVNAIENVSFSVFSGEFMTLCGPSGCGKSTLLRHFKTVLSPHGRRSGRVLFKEAVLNDITADVQSSEIGFVGQSPDDQIVTDKVWHELAFGLESLGLDSDTIRRKTAETAAFFGIQSWFEKNVSELSGGQKQLLNLASVLVMKPSVLILDEPTAQLDPIAASEFISVLVKVNRELGITVIITEHRLEEIIPVSDRLLAMDKGRIICDGTPDKTAEFLKSSGMFAAMPAPMRIWSALPDNETCPLTVGEGRVWLESYSLSHTPEPLKREYISSGGETVLDAENIWFRYDRDGEDILKGVSVKAEKGELLAVIGGNGTGKTTLLSVLSGANRPYRGHVKVKGKKFEELGNLCGKVIGAVPQNPSALFVKKTLHDDLSEMLDGKKTAPSDKSKAVTAVMRLCGIEKLALRHPYDLSGGERQKAALAKVLLADPEILLLDEPTKGLDAEFKKTFAAILRELCLRGRTVIMVSHDIEFCAEYADRCVMLFNGAAGAEGRPSEFFAENMFYTTAASRMAGGIVGGAVTVDDVISAFGGQTEEPASIDTSFLDGKIPEVESLRRNEPEKIKAPLKRRIFGFSGLAVIAAAICLSFGLIKAPETLYGVNFEYILLILSAVLFAAAFWKRFDRRTYEIQTEIKKRRIKKRTAAAAAMILLAVPLTVFIGVYYLGDKKYLFISLLVMLECMLPFFMIFEGRKPQARELVIISVLCALGVAGRAAFYMLPQFKPVLALVIISGVSFGGETGFLVGAVTMLVSNMFFQQGPWTPWQMFAMGIIGFLSGIIFRKGFLRRDRISLCIFGMLSAVIIYGGIMNPSAAITAGIKLNRSALLSYYAAGLPLDVVHGLATAVFLFIGAEPMLDKLDRVKVKYGLIE